MNKVKGVFSLTIIIRLLGKFERWFKSEEGCPSIHTDKQNKKRYYVVYQLGKTMEKNNLGNSNGAEEEIGDEEMEMNGDDCNKSSDDIGDDLLKKYAADVLAESDEEMNDNNYSDDDDNESEDEGSLGFSSDDPDIEYEDEVNNSLDAQKRADVFKSSLKRVFGSSRKVLADKSGIFRRTRKEKPLEPEVQRMLGEANEAYVKKDFDKAEEIYQKIITINDTCYPAYKTLGEIYDIKRDKGRCCILWICAGSLRTKDYDLWITCAKMSEELGHLEQADHCYKMASLADPNDLVSLFERARTNMKLDKFPLALRYLEKIRKRIPEDTKVIKEIAECFVNMDQPLRAIDLYEEIMKRNMEVEEHDFDKEKYPTKFGWSELNILSELYYKQRAYLLGLKTIKKVARWINGRSSQTFWDEIIVDDSEFDDRKWTSRFSGKFSSVDDFTLPVELRAQLLKFRLIREETKEALIQLEQILLNSPKSFPHTLTDLGETFQNAGMFLEALKCFTPIAHLINIDDSVTLGIAMCSTELGNYEEAELAFKEALSRDPNNKDIKLELAKLYFKWGKSEELLNISNEIMENDDDELTTTTTNENQTLALITPHKRPLKYKQKRDFINQEKKANFFVSSHYIALKVHTPGFMVGISEDVQKWIEIASDLIDFFNGTKELFPTLKRQGFTGLNVTRHRQSEMTVDLQIKKLVRLQEANNEIGKEKTTEQVKNAENLRGVSFNDWFDIYMHYALALVKYENTQDAYALIQRAKTVNVFYQHPDRVRWMNLVHLSIAYIAKDFKMVDIAGRLIINDCHDSSRSLRLYSCGLNGGNQASYTFISNNTQKFYLRQVKAYDSIILKKPITGMAKVEVLTDPKDPQLLQGYGNILMAGRSYTPSLFYYLRAQNLAPKDPLILLSAGLAHVHSALKRLAPNRHLQILQGLAVLRDYYDIRRKMGPHESQEADFNMARVYHMLNLANLAIPYYENVLTYENLDPTYDLKRQAAYNLQFIYNINGNGLLARRIVEKYLVIE